MQAVASAEQWSEIYDRIAELIAEHRTTLVFVNTRRLAERVAHNLAQRIGEEHVAAHHGSLSRDRRLRTEQRLKDGEMRAIVAKPLAGATATIEFDEEGYPPMASTAASTALLDTLNRVNADLGLPKMEPQDPLKRGAADISWVAKDVEAGLNGLGPAGSGAHAPGEAVDIPSIWRQAKRAALLMSHLAVEKR